MGKHYEFTGDTKEIKVQVLCDISQEVTYQTKTLHQIRATRSFTSRLKKIQSGTLGGWIESEDNLSQDDNSWLDEKSSLCNGAKLDMHSRLYNTCVEGNIVVTASVLKNSNVQHLCTNEKMGYIQYSNVEDSELKHAIFVNGVTLIDVKPHEYGHLTLSGGITLRNMEYGTIHISGKATFFNCHHTGKIAGDIKGGLFRNVTFKNGSYLNGSFHLQNTTLKNISFFGGTYALSDVILETVYRTSITGDMKWNEVTLRSTQMRLDAKTTFEHVYGHHLKNLSAKYELSMTNVRLESGTDLTIPKASNKKTVLNGTKVKHKNKTKQYGIIIQSTLLNMIDSEIHGNVRIEGEWYLRNSMVHDFVTLYSDAKMTKLVDSHLRDFSGIRVKNMSRYKGKSLDLIDDNLIEV